MQVLVANFGSFVGKTSERLVIKEKGKVAAEVPFADLEQLTIATSGVTLSSDVIRECAERGIQITFLTSSGRPYAKIVSPNLTATIITRREQLYAYRDDRAVALARAFVEGKIRNQINTLRYFAKYRKSSQPEIYHRLQEVVQTLSAALPEVAALGSGKPPRGAGGSGLTSRKTGGTGRSGPAPQETSGFDPASVAGEADPNPRTSAPSPAHPAVSSGSDPSLSAQEPASGPADPTSPSGSDPSPAVQDPVAEPLPDPAGRALIDQLRPVFLSIEGRASKVYWDAVQWLTEGKVAFEGREHRGATDPVNVMLNYGYGMLYSQIWTAVLLAGLEPFAGFLHVDRPGKPSLVLDLIEEFRQHVVDRAVIAAVNKGFTVDLAEGKLTDESRRALAEKILERLEARELFEGQRLALRAIIQRQARRLASYLRGEAAYRPFVGGW